MNGGKAPRRHGERWPASSQGEVPQKKPALPIPRPWTSGTQDCEKKSICCLSHPVHGIYYGSPSKWKTSRCPKCRAPSPSHTPVPCEGDSCGQGKFTWLLSSYVHVIMLAVPFTWFPEEWSMNKHLYKEIASKYTGVYFHGSHPLPISSSHHFLTKKYYRNKVEKHSVVWSSFGSAAKLNLPLSAKLELAVNDYKWKSVTAEGSYLQQKARTGIS